MRQELTDVSASMSATFVIKSMSRGLTGVALYANLLTKYRTGNVANGKYFVTNSARSHLPLRKTVHPLNCMSTISRDKKEPTEFCTYDADDDDGDGTVIGSIRL